MEVDNSSELSSSFTLTQPLEILGTLRSLAREKRLIQLRVPTQDASILTTLLHIESNKETLIFDGTSHDALTRQIQEAKLLYFEASENGVRVSFTAGPAQVAHFDERPAIRVPLPDELIRIQRRESFRVATSLTNPAYCTVPVSDTVGKVKLQLVDLSATGLGAIETDQELNAPPGQVFLGCTLSLPDNEPLDVTVQLVHTREIERGGKQHRHYGFAFENLRGATLARVQRYVATLEREAVAKKRGW